MENSMSPNTRNQSSFLKLDFSSFSSIDERYEIHMRAVEIYRLLIKAGLSPRDAKHKVETLYADAWKQASISKPGSEFVRHSVFGDL
jgi:hypothetical protein